MTIRSSIPILISGPPRSGTTWIGRICATAPGIRYVFEPDNRKTSFLALGGFGLEERFPALKKGQPSPDAHRLWRRILAWGPADSGMDRVFKSLTPRCAELVEKRIGETSGLAHICSSMRTVEDDQRSDLTAKMLLQALRGISSAWLSAPVRPGDHESLVVKSVHSMFCLDWIASEFDVRPVLTRRNPHALYASYERLGMPDGSRNLARIPQIRSFLDAINPGWVAFESTLRDPVAFQTAVLCRYMDEVSQRNPDWPVVDHDELCAAPERGFEHLFEKLELPFNDRTRVELRDSMQPGSGFKANRVPSEQSTKWQLDLTKEQIGRVDAACAFFQLEARPG